MLIIYCKTAWRTLRKNKFFSFINIAGLAIGMTACMLIIEYSNFEMSFDYANKNIDQLYRVTNDRYQQGKLTQHTAMTYSGIGKALKNEYPEIAAYSRVTPYRVEVISFKDKKLADQRAIAVDNSFLGMFSCPMLQGDSHTALLEPNTVILSESLARKLQDIKPGTKVDFNAMIGSLVIFDRDSIPYKITGICKDAPANDYLHYDLLMSYVSLYSNNGNNRYVQADNDFTLPNFWQYIMLKPGTNYKSLEAKLPAFSSRHFPDNKKAGREEKFHLQPVSGIHLYSDLENEIGTTGSITTVESLLVIALFILIIAWANYINLATAKATEKAKEVGIRKVSGAGRGQLMAQFLTEALAINLLAFAISLVLVQVLQNSFNGLVQRPTLSLSFLMSKGLAGYWISGGLLCISIAGILVSGLYPAWVLSSFKPTQVLKGGLLRAGKGLVLRKMLVTGQYAITIVLIIGAMVVWRQVQFMGNQPLGYDMEQLLVLRKPVLAFTDSTFGSTAGAFTQALKQLPHVQGAAASARIPGDELGKISNVYRTDIYSTDRFTFSNMGVDKDFLSLYKMKLVAGRNFSNEDYSADVASLHHLIINESAAKILGLSPGEDPAGKSVMLFNRKWDIVGIVGDFHQQSLHRLVEPTILLPSLLGPYTQFSVRVDTKDLHTTMAGIKNVYDAFFPGNLFDYYFLDAKFNRQYSNDRLFGQAFGIFAGLAIGIAGLGLFGLSLLAAAQRSKEISVRKVLGASVTGILLLFSKDFFRLVIIAFIIAAPVGWYCMHSWLQQFPYRLEISWWIFALSGLLALVIAMATVSIQTIKIARSNPVKSLR